MSFRPRSAIGHYDVTALIGEGGMGQVYQATDTTLNRQIETISASTHRYSYNPSQRLEGTGRLGASVMLWASA